MTLLYCVFSAVLEQERIFKHGVGFYIDNPDHVSMALKWCAEGHKSFDINKYGDICGNAAKAKELHDKGIV